MKTGSLENMVKGWFVGNFDPVIYRTKDVEAAVKRYRQGDYEESHYHKIATEITVVISGEVEMNGIRYKENDIIVMEPGDVTDFKAVTDVVNVVLKIPGANDDKYLKED